MKAACCGFFLAIALVGITTPVYAGGGGSAVTCKAADDQAIYLSLENRSEIMAISPGVWAEGSDVIRVTATATENANGLAYSVLATIMWTDSDAPVDEVENSRWTEVGSLSAFPIDQPGVFSLRIAPQPDPRERAAAVVIAKTARLKFELVPSHSIAESDKLKVKIGPVRLCRSSG